MLIVMTQAASREHQFLLENGHRCDDDDDDDDYDDDDSNEGNYGESELNFSKNLTMNQYQVVLMGPQSKLTLHRISITSA
jgi:hypothetical protein